MKTLLRFALSLCAFGVLLVPSKAAAMIYWRVSVKIILDSNGNRPVGTSTTANFATPYNFDTPQRIRAIFDEYNGILDRMGWGYRFDVTEVLDLSGVSQWFSVNARDGNNRNNLEIAAKLNPSVYAYRLNALNIYVNNSSSGVSGGHLPLLGDVIFAGATSYRTLAFHEIGHALGLCHTFSCNCNGCGETAQCDSGSNSDNIADTIRDSPCWNDQNTIAINNFNRIYSLLTADQQNQVDLVWFNLMSYHSATNNPLDRLSHDQWERIVDVSNFEKLNVASGRTIFVDPNNSCVRPEDLSEPFKTLAGFVPGWSWGTRSGLGVTLSPQNPPPGAPALPCPPPPVPCSLSVCLGGPHKSIGEAVAAAANGDRLQIKPGNYNINMRITKPLTLTASGGQVNLGR